MPDSGAAKSTTSDTAVTLFAAGGPTFNHVQVYNGGSVPGWISVDGGTSWIAMPATGSVQTISNLTPSRSAVLFKRTASGSNVTNVTAVAYHGSVVTDMPHTPWTIDIQFLADDRALHGYQGWVDLFASTSQAVTITSHAMTSPDNQLTEVRHTTAFSAINLSGDYEIEFSMVYHYAGGKTRGIQWWFGNFDGANISLDTYTNGIANGHLTFQLTTPDSVSDGGDYSAWTADVIHVLRVRRHGNHLLLFIDDVQVLDVDNEGDITPDGKTMNISQDSGAGSGAAANFYVTRIRARNL